MSEWTSPEEKSERRRRVKDATFDQRLAWLRQMQEFAYESGAWQRAILKKRANTWKYGVSK